MIEKNTKPNAALLLEISKLRRKFGSQSPKHFAHVYLDAHFNKSFSRMHQELFSALDHITSTGSGRLAVAAPRGHAKSTVVSLCYLLWCLVTGREKLILMISATQEQAVQLLRTVKEELRKNEKLLQDFPEVCLPENRRLCPWKNNRILLPNGSMVCAYGSHQSLRGAKQGQHRPGLILVDDLESQEEAISEEQRRKLQSWFSGTLMHAGSPSTNVIVVGTLLHFDSLLSRLLSAEHGVGWQRLKYQALEKYADRSDLWELWSGIYRGECSFEGKSGPDAAWAFFQSQREYMLEGGQTLWPEMEDYYTLMVIREREGRLSFQAEKQNEPLDPEQCIFHEAKFQYWEDSFPNERSLLSSLEEPHFLGACDPSLGTGLGKGDYSAIVILLADKKRNTKYVIGADIARRSPDEIIERIVHYAKLYRFSRFVLEVNHFQTLLVDNLRKRAEEAGVHLPVHGVLSRINKITRIANLEPELSQRRMYFKRDQKLLIEQLRQFPLGKFNDGPDALEMAIQSLAHLDRGNWAFQSRT